MRSNENSRREIRRRAERQYGLITLADCRATGLTDRATRWHVTRGDWARVHPGVYRLRGAPPSPEQDTLAAVLSCGPTAVASHGSAAWLWNLQQRPPDVPSVVVASMANPVARRVIIHRSAPIPHADVHQRRGIWCTGPLRTVVDLAAVVDLKTLDDAIDRGLASRLFTVPALEAEVGRLSQKGRRGVGILRSRLRQRGFIGAPRPSVLESRMYRLLAGAGIVPVGIEVRSGDGWYRVDAALGDRITLEASGYRYHWSPESMQSDETRRNRLTLQGHRILTYTWWDVMYDGGRVTSELRQILDQSLAG